MARISPAPPEQYALCVGEDAPLRQQILAQRPPLAAALAQLSATLRQERLLSGRLIELVRLRVAFWNQCRSCMAVRHEPEQPGGFQEALVCSLERPEEADDLTDRERAAIAYADLMATDHLSIDDSTFERLRTYFSEPEIVELAINVGSFVGFGRMMAALHVVDDLPEEYGSDDRLAPWTVARMVAPT